MGDADHLLSKNDDPTSKEDQHYYAALQTHIHTFLPFINQVFKNSERLNIPPTNASKLRTLCDMVASKRIRSDRLKICKNFLYDLYENYGTSLNYYLSPDFKTGWMQETKLNEKENNLSSNSRFICNKSNQKQNSESKLFNKTPVPGTNYENIVNNEMGCLEVLTPNNENTIDKNFANVKISESSCSKNAVDDSMISMNYLPELSDSCLRLNDTIDISENAAIANFNKYDASIPHNELVTQISDEMVKQKTNQVVQKNMLIGINLDNIDINFLKDLIDNIKRVICVEPIQPLSLPPLGLMKLETSRMQLISTTEPNSSKLTQDNVLSKSSSIICAQLNTETNDLYKTSSSNENKEMFIPALQPGKLIELENSKVICASLNIDTLRPAINLNKKNTDIAGTSLPPNPKITHESLLSSENSGSAFNTPATLKPNKDNSNVKLSKTKTQEMSVYNGQISTSHTNIQLLKPQYSSKYNGDSIQFKNRLLFQNPKIKNHNDKKNGYSRFNNSTRIHDNPSHTEPLTRYCDPLPYKSNNISSSRKLKSVKTTQSSNSKLYIEFKYRKQNKGWAKNKNQMNQDQDQYRRKIKKGNCNSGNIYGLSSTDKHQVKSKECYGHYKIIKNITNPESKELKMVIVKLDKHTKTSENCNMDISCNDKQTDDKLINVEKAEKTKKRKLNFETVTRSMIGQPNVLMCPLQNSKPFDDETKCNKSVEQNSNTSTVIVNKSKIKKARLLEVEKLHANINKMFDCEAVLNASNIRQCRTNKQVDYINANVRMSKKKRTSNFEQLDTNDDQSNLFCNIRKLKNTKKNVKKSKIKLNAKVKFVKKSMRNKTLPLVVKRAVLNKMYNKQPETIIDENLPESVICVNPSATAYDKTLPESNMLNILLEQAINEESIKNQPPTKKTRFSRDQPEIELSEYTLKEKSKKIVLAGLSCELINSMLLFKCSISNCLENQYSSAYFTNFSKHINKNHQFVIWDGNCGVCHHKLQIVSGQYYVRNALEHLVSHHLVLKNNDLKSIGLKTGGLSSSCQEKKSQSVKNSVRCRYLAGDRLSIKNNMFENSEQSCNNILLGDQCQTTVNLNITHDSNDKRFPLLSSRISDVKSLNKGKVKTSKINSSASDNDDLGTWMKAKTNCEVVLPNPEIFLEAGQQIVNNGVTIYGKIYCLIDAACKKDYIRKFREFPMDVMKTQLAFNKMSALPRLLNLFKCMERSCAQMFSSKELFKLHMQSHFSKYAEEKKRNKKHNVQQFKLCAYCFKAFDDEESLANHIAEKYTFCKYFCPHCFYRAYTASHVLVHKSVVHANIKSNLIIKMDGSACENPKEILLVVDFKNFVLPYKCNVGFCGFSCYLPNEFVEHLNQEHQQCDKICCYICANDDDGEGLFAFHSTLMITHFKLHHLNKYQCIFCLFGSETIDSMIKHLAFEHFEYEPLCLERSTVSDNCESKDIKNLKILKLKIVIDNGMVEVKNVPAETISISEFLPWQSKKRSIECPDNVSLVMKSARINEESQPSQTVVNTVPNSALMAEKCTSMSLAFESKLVMINDVDQNHMRESLKTTRIRSESTNKKEESNVTSNKDVALSKKEELNEDTKKRICLDIKESIIELDKLFVCEECDKVFSNGDMYYAHLKLCPFWDCMAGRKCMYCAKVFKRKLNMTKHIKRHGPDRFKCSLCNLKEPTEQVIRIHMKKCHRIININFVPEHPNLIDFDKDNFIVLEDNIIMQKITQEQPNYTNNFVNSLITQQNTSLKKKHYSIIERDELDKKIIEVISDNNMKTEILPQFIQKNMLYKCSIPHCTFTGMTEDILKKHISIFHPTCQYYICPHCPPQYIISKVIKQNQIKFHLMHHGSNLYRCQYCDYIDFNRVEMRTHMRNTHLLELTSSEQSYIFVIRKTMLEDDSIDKGRNKGMLLL